MSIRKFGYSVKSLQKDKIENLENELESQTKLININLMMYLINYKHILINLNTEGTEGIQQKTGGTEGALRALRVEEIQFNNDETQIVVNAKLFLDISKRIEDIKRNLKCLQQDF